MEDTCQTHKPEQTAHESEETTYQSVVTAGEEAENSKVLEVSQAQDKVINLSDFAQPSN